MAVKAGKAPFTALLQKAAEKMEAAKIMFDYKRYDDAVSRAYYAVFHVMTVVLLSRGLSFSSHGQVIGVFNREFVKTGIFPRDTTSIIQALFDDRQIGDYGICSEISKTTARQHLLAANRLLKSARKYIGAKNKQQVVR